MAFLSLPKNTRFICLDQTWLSMSDFRKYKWGVKGSTNSVAALNISPRITMHIACDSNGLVWLSLFQSHSNASVFALFIRALSERLNMEDPDWRSNTVLILDGAPYHQAEASKALLEGL